MWVTGVSNLHRALEDWALLSLLSLLLLLLLLLRRRTDADLQLAGCCQHTDKNSLLVSVAGIVPWQQRHISMETQPYICLWLGRRRCSWWYCRWWSSLRDHVLSYHTLKLHLLMCWSYKEGRVVSESDTYQWMPSGLCPCQVVGNLRWTHTDGF